MQRFYSILLNLSVLLTPIIAQDLVIPVWEKVPNLIPGTPYVIEHSRHDTTWGSIATGITYPTLEIYHGSGPNDNKTAIIIFPGGGYKQLATDLEGSEIALWLQARGITAAVLRYRLPDPATCLKPYLAPIQDAQKSIRILRSKASEWGIDHHRIGVMGFSAGGHLAATAATHYQRDYLPKQEGGGNVSLRPDFAILGYPVVNSEGSSVNTLLGKHATEKLALAFSIDTQITKQTSPIFIVASTNDAWVPFDKHALPLYQILREEGVESRLYSAKSSHYPHHGFGLAKDQTELMGWPDAMLDWLEKISKYKKPVLKNED